MRKRALLALGVVLTACANSSPQPRVTFPTPAPTTRAPTTPAPSATPAPPSPTQLDQVKLRLTPIATFAAPIALAIRANDPALYVAEQDGMVRAWQSDATRDVLDITTLTSASGEQGLLGLAFAPDGKHLYVDYTDNNGDSNVDEYAIGTNGTVDPKTRRRVLFQEQPYANHNGGHIVFGPDGLLYIGLGDGGSAGDPDRNGQDPKTFLAKILRIDPRASGNQPYTVPPSNPYFGRTDVLPETWSTGLRNPWRFSFDPANGDLWIGDVGQGSWEEIDFVPAAQGAGKATNFGWSAFEGTHGFNTDQKAPGSWMPVYEYGHGSAGCSVTGGVVYRGSTIPALRGAYVYSDYCAGGVNALAVNGQKLVAQKRLSNDPPNVSSFGVGPNGEVYVLSLGGGLFRLDAG
jgi:glucose/arabinose dehydrogenase